MLEKTHVYRDDVGIDLQNFFFHTLLLIHPLILVEQVKRDAIRRSIDRYFRLLRVNSTLCSRILRSNDSHFLKSFNPHLSIGSEAVN